MAQISYDTGGSHICTAERKAIPKDTLSVCLKFSVYIFLIVSSTKDISRRPQQIKTSGQGCYFYKIFIKLIELQTPAPWYGEKLFTIIMFFKHNFFYDVF